jgi:hypothetical protein
MSNRSHCLVFCLGFLGLSLFSRGQSSVNTPYIPSIIPPSPNAAALMKFTDVPVSTYTGTADVSVPIYTIKAKGLDVPVGISYHTGGIRLEEEAGWVGLGWALNAGGMISRTIMGHDDFGTQGDIYLTNLCPQLAGDISSGQPQQQLRQVTPYAFDFWCNYQVQTSNGMEDFWPAFGSGSDTYDMEPDIFSYSFPGHSGKFILTRAGNVVMQKQENIRIQFQGSGNTVTFTVTDDQGNKFYFNTLEKTSVAQYTSISSWELSKIVTQQQDSILFNYTPGGATASSMGDVHQTYANYCTAVNGFFPTTSVVPSYINETLQSIDFPDGHLAFNFDASRSDLYGAYKLDSVLIYSKNAGGTLTYQRQDNFYYSYFNPTLGASSGTPMEYYRLKLDSVKEKSGTTVLPPYAFTYNNPDPGLGTKKHDFSVDHWGYYNGADNSTKGLIPTMDVAYNPNVNETGWSQVAHYSGANRNPAFPAMQIFSLQQVKYPTGGKTVLTYQANDYDYSNSIRGGAPDFQYVQTAPIVDQITATHHGTTSGTVDLTNIFPIIGGGDAGTNVTISIAFRYQNNNVSTYSNTSGKLYFTIGGIYQDIHTATVQPGGPVTSATWTVALAPGVYNWSAYIDPTYIDTATVFAGIYVSVQFNETQTEYNLLQNNSEISPASGLRVQSISNYKDANTIASQKVFSYSYMDDKQQTGTPQQYSYGRLMSIPSYARYWITKTNQGGNCTALALYSSTMSSLTSVIQGNIVGYDQVTETNVDPLTGQDIGQTVYSYHNNSDTAIRFAGYGIPGVFNIGDNLNGLLLSKIDYADRNGVFYKVGETDYNYHATNRTIYYSPKYQYWPSVGTGGSGCVPDTGVERETSAWFYPSIKSERVLLDSKTSISYQQGDATQAVSSTQTNFYDNPAHYQVTRAKTLDSKGDMLVTQMRYPQDYIPTGQTLTGNAVMDTLIGRNMVSETIEKRDSLFYPGSSSGYVTGAQLNMYRIVTANGVTVVPDRTYRLDLQAPVTNFAPFSFSGNTINVDGRNRVMVAFQQYDAFNNVQQYTTIDPTPVSIIWDYNHVYPIAQVKNAAWTEVAATSFEADGNGGWAIGTGTTNTTTGLTGNSSYALTGTLSRSGLSSTNTYVVSYWVIGTSNPFSVAGAMSGYPVKGKTVTINGQQWTYYEYKITGVTTTTVSGTGTLDELRLYPANAQMTTYTYSPLKGTTTQCDVDNRVTYYFYDGLGRLKYLKDQDGNIVKTIDYHYQGQTSN